MLLFRLAKGHGTRAALIIFVKDKPRDLPSASVRMTRARASNVLLGGVTTTTPLDCNVTYLSRMAHKRG